MSRDFQICQVDYDPIGKQWAAVVALCGLEVEAQRHGDQSWTWKPRYGTTGRRVAPSIAAVLDELAGIMTGAASA